MLPAIALLAIGVLILSDAGSAGIGGGAALLALGAVLFAAGAVLSNALRQIFAVALLPLLTTRARRSAASRPPSWRTPCA